MSNSYFEEQTDSKKTTKKKTTKTNKVSKDLGIESNIQDVSAADSANIIQGPKKSKGPAVSNLGDIDGVIAAKSGNRKDTPKPKAEESEKKVAVFSNRNVSWEGIGKVSRGYNIVSEEEAEKWLTRSHVRLATPEEIAEEFKK